MPVRLVVHFPERPPASFALDEELSRVVVGRDPSCEVVLEDHRVSRRHARLQRGDTGWSVEDLGSKNGTLLEGLPASGGGVDSGSWISFGGLLAQFEVISPEQVEADARRTFDRWQTSLSLQTRFDPGAGLESLLEQVLRSVLEVSMAERGFVLLTLPEGGLDLAASVGVAADELLGPTFDGSAGAVQRTLDTGRPTALGDVSLDTFLGGRASVVESEVRALVCLPLKVLDRLVGVVYADSRELGQSFSDLDLEILTALASHAGLAVAVAQIHREVAGVRQVMPPGETLAGLPAVWERSVPQYRSSPASDWRSSLPTPEAAGLESASLDDTGARG
ncbi:MAG: FHA domain-containing protein [Acidobacteriota bacterium]|nr:FHA domain-containing protein [Acidobacteriota bacterium]